MKVAILQCDEVLEKNQAKFGSYNGMIQHMFTSIDERFEFDCFDCRQGEYPEDIQLYDFYITTGSKASVNDNCQWIDQLVSFVRRLAAHKKKLIGICFGHQILALANDGMVEKSEKGWGIGVAKNRIVATPDWMSEKKQELKIIVSHQDQVTQLPDGAEVIAESDFCPFFVVQWSEYSLSIQGHPEWNRKYSRTLINDRRAIIDPDRIESGLHSLTHEPDNKVFVSWIMEFVGN